MPDTASILVRGGRIIDPSQNHDDLADLLVENGKITALDKPGAIPEARASRILDARGAWVIPGCVDVHVHLRDPGQDHKETIETGTRAAAAGGFTAVACMANTSPVNDTAEVTAMIRDRAKRTGSCRVYPIGAITRGLRGEELADIGAMVAEGARAISDDGVTLMNSLLMRLAMERAKSYGVPVISHSEDSNLARGSAMNEGGRANDLDLRGTPAAAEEIMVARDIALCRLTGCPLHIAHISTALALEHLRRAKETGLPVTAEVTPHHLELTEEVVQRDNSNFKMSPPLRSATDREALREALATGLIDMIATDHAPHSLLEKAVEFEHAANGIIGLQTALPITYGLVEAGRISVQRWVEALTSSPAKLLGLPLGTLKVGQPADVTVFNPSVKWTFTEAEVASKSRNSPFLERELKGRVLWTLVAGKVKLEESPR